MVQNSVPPNFFLKCFIPYFTLGSCIVHGIAIHLMAYRCPPKGPSQRYFNHVTYFHDNNYCDPVNIVNCFPNEFDETKIRTIYFPEQARFSAKATVLARVTLWNDVVWGGLSLGMIILAFCDIRSKSALYIYFPWICSAIFSLVIDFYGTFFYGSHLKKIHNLQDWLEFVGAKYYGLEFHEASNELKAIFLSAPLLFFLFYSRCIVFLFVNIFHIIKVSKFAKDACTFKK